MFNLARSCALAALAVLCLGGEPLHAQVAPLRYWIPGGPFGLGGDAGPSSDTYGNFPSFNAGDAAWRTSYALSLIHISEPTRLGMISYAVFCLKKKKK